MRLILLLIQFILIKIGNLPLWLIKSSFKIAKGGILRTQRALESTATKIKRGVTARRGSRRVAAGAKRSRMHGGKPSWQDPERWLFHRHRGRPRKTPLIPFYIRKLKQRFNPYFPKKTRIVIVLSALLIIIYTYTSFIFKAAYQLPSPERLLVSDNPMTTEFYDRSGKLLHRLYEGRNRTLTKLDEVPRHLIWATISSEDKNFYLHPGFDPIAIFRAIYSQVSEGSQQGASTITQQLVKNTLLTPEKTITRKVKEAILAFWAERIYSKDQILQMYFNEAPYGGPLWGVDAAAQTYFGKKPKDLTLAESAFLAGLPASPTKYSPYGTSPQLAKSRQEWVLQRMVEDGYISQKEGALAKEERLFFQPRSNNIEAAHFVFYVRDLLAQKYGERVVSQGGLKVTTSLDLDLQHQVEDIVQEEVESLTALNVKNGAAMVTDPKGGQILAMVGSRDYHYPLFGNFNVTLALRQPGSSIKVVTYATAFKKGFLPGNTILDAPVSFKNPGSPSYTPVNYDGRFHGPVSIRVALGSSFNIPAVKMLSEVGIDSMIETAQDLGITTFGDPTRFGLSLTLGGGEIRMIDMMSVYGTLATSGSRFTPTPILKVTDSEGNVLEEYQDRGKKVLDASIAYLINNILSDNSARTIAFGPNSLLNLGKSVAVKTGTSDNKRDNWTFGYTEDFVVGVWVGNNDNSPMHPALTSGVTGAAPIWNKITKLMLENKPSYSFTKPGGLVEITVDGRRDLTIAGAQPKSLVKVRRDGENTIFFDAYSSFATPSASRLFEPEPQSRRPAEQAKIEGGSTN